MAASDVCCRRPWDCATHGGTATFTRGHTYVVSRSFTRGPPWRLGGRGECACAGPPFIYIRKPAVPSTDGDARRHRHGAGTPRGTGRMARIPYLPCYVLSLCYLVSRFNLFIYLSCSYIRF